LSVHTLGRPTGLTVGGAPPAASGQQIVLTAQGHRAAGGPSIRVRSNHPALVRAGSVVRMATAYGLVTADTQVWPGQSSDLPLDTVTPTGVQPGNPISLSAGGKAYVVSTAIASIPVYGTTDTDLQINEVTRDATSAVGDAATTWTVEEVSSKSWQLDRRGLYRASDPGYQLIEAAALSGAPVLVRRVLPDEDGNPDKVQTGLALVTAFRNPSPAAGLIEASWVFKGVGKLTIGPVSEHPSMPHEPVDLSGVMLDFSDARKQINQLVFT